MKKLLLLFLFGTMAYAQPSISTPEDISECDHPYYVNQTGTSYDGLSEFNLTHNDNIMLAGMDASLYTVTYHETAQNAEQGTNAINVPIDYYSGAAVIYTRVAEIANPANFVTASFSLVVIPLPNPIPEIPTVYLTDTDGDEIAMVDLNSLNSQVLAGQDWENLEVSYYQTEMDAHMGITPIINPESWFTMSSTLYVRVNAIDSPCYVISSITFMVQGDEPFLPPPPTGEAEQTLTEGETLADIEVEGENIQWYETEFGDTPLSMATVLVDDTTYYAAQSIEGVESTQRLAVTVNLTAGLEDMTFNTLKYYPNPATNILNIENTNGIDTVAITNTLGQAVMKQAVNNSNAQVDVSSLSKGVYFVRITSGSAAKIIKIIKE